MQSEGQTVTHSRQATQRGFPSGRGTRRCRLRWRGARGLRLLGILDGDRAPAPGLDPEEGQGVKDHVDQEMAGRDPGPDEERPEEADGAEHGYLPTQTAVARMLTRLRGMRSFQPRSMSWS